MTWRTIVICDDCYLRRRRTTNPELVDKPVRLVVVEDTCDDCGKEGVAAIPIRANVNRPTPMDIQPITEEQFNTILEHAVPPICPGCLAVATMTPGGWETAHEIDCSWMQDPESERYD